MDLLSVQSMILVHTEVKMEVFITLREVIYEINIKKQHIICHKALVEWCIFCYISNVFEIMHKMDLYKSTIIWMFKAFLIALD